MEIKALHVGVALLASVLLGGCLGGTGSSQPEAVAAQQPVVGDLSATVSLSNIYGSSMVFQRDQPIPVIGKGEPGKSLVLTLGNETVVAEVAENGHFGVEFAPLSASSEPLTLRVRGKNDEIVLDDILVGDVWLGSGQSNMEWRVRRSMNYEAEQAAANYPQIRYYNVPVVPSVGKIAEDIGGGRHWTVVTPESVGDASAVMYFFARDLQQETGVPIGIINSSLGGSRIEPWISVAAYEEAGEAEMVLSAGMIADPQEQERLRNAFNARFAQWEANLFKQYAAQVEAASGWSAAELDVSTWFPAKVPSQFSEFNGVSNGVVWFRRTVDIPAEWAGRELKLSLGAIDDCDQTFWNGELVGQTMTDVPHYWEAPRVYTIAGSKVRGGENVIAIRVIDYAFDGGIRGDARNIRIFPADEPTAAIPLAGNDWVAKVEFQINWDETAPRPEPLQTTADDRRRVSALYNGMIAPLQFLPISGVLWYQGESNVGAAERYSKLFALLINSWRAEWEQPEMPFLFVQLSSLLRHAPKTELLEGVLEALQPEESNWAVLRESQESALSLPATGMAVTIDVGDPIDIHPANKQDVGKRLALEALRTAYGQDVLSRGPEYRSMQAEGNAIRIFFDKVGSGLKAQGDAPGGFAIAGEDGVFYWADAVIDGDSVVVSSETVSKPVAVRYAWANYPHRANMFNAEGLPMAPFRTNRPQGR